MKISKVEYNYVIEKNDGTSVILAAYEAGLLVNFIGKEGLRNQIDDRVAAAEDDYLDISQYVRDEFIQEIFEEFEDEIDYGNSVSDDEIDDKISDLATFYDFVKEE